MKSIALARQPREATGRFSLESLYRGARFPASPSACLEVEDTGIGMDSGKVSELWEPFKQASEGISREYEGTGLGLTLVQRVTDEIGGTVEVETEKGEGSCVTVRLPKAGSPEEASQEA